MSFGFSPLLMAAWSHESFEDISGFQSCPERSERPERESSSSSLAAPGLAIASRSASTGGVFTPLAMSVRPLSQDSCSAEVTSPTAVTEGVQELELDGVGDKRGLLEEEDSTSSRGCSEAMTNDCLISEEERICLYFLFSYAMHTLYNDVM